MVFFKPVFTICALMIISNSTFALTQCDDINSPEDVRIYFVNGMGNQIYDINKSRTRLKASLGNLGENVYRSSINHKESRAKEILEAVIQRLGAVDPIEFWEWWSLPHASTTPIAFKEALASEIHSAASVEYFVDADLTAMVDSYLSDLNAGKKVVLVSHSQGNFYANNAHAYITSLYPNLGASMGVVAVATPASYVAGNGSVTQNSKDRVIFGLVSPAFNVVPANVTITGTDLANHGFSSTYMLKQSAKIVGDIQTTINRLPQPEVNPDCDDRIADITTLSAKDVTDVSATLEGRLTDGKNVDAWLVYDKNSLNVICNNALHDGIGPYTAETVIEKSLTNLQSNTLYYARACAKGGTGGTKDGGLIQFITTRSSAQVSNLGAVAIGETTATIRGLLTSGTGVDVWFRWGLSTSSLICNGSGFDGTGIYSAGTTVSLSVSGLSIDSLYKYKVCAKGSDGITNSSEESEFQTNGQSEITTLEALVLFPNKATVKGELTAGQNSKVWVNYVSTETVPQTCAATWPNHSNSSNFDAPHSFEILLGNLYSNTKYYYRYCAYNGIGDFSDGGARAFWTL